MSVGAALWPTTTATECQTCVQWEEVCVCGGWGLQNGPRRGPYDGCWFVVFFGKGARGMWCQSVLPPPCVPGMSTPFGSQVCSLKELLATICWLQQEGHKGLGCSIFAATRMQARLLSNKEQSTKHPL